MKTIQIGTKRQAGAATLDSLFRPVSGRTATKRERYDRGKYANNLRGRTLDVPANVAALWTERRTDRNGPYWALFCLSTDKEPPPVYFGHATDLTGDTGAR